jgi:hypothetical protein
MYKKGSGNLKGDMKMYKKDADDREQNMKLYKLFIFCKVVKLVYIKFQKGDSGTRILRGYL